MLSILPQEEKESPHFPEQKGHLKMPSPPRGPCLFFYMYGDREAAVTTLES